MNIRQKYQLKTLVAKGELDIFKISEEFNLNPRTIRYDLEIIDNLLNKLKINRMIIKKNIAKINLNDEEKNIVLNEISGFNYYETKLTAEERMVMIIFDLCWENRLIKIDDISNKYFVSRSTINNDIVSIKRWCNEQNLKFRTIKGKGIKILKKVNDDTLSKVIRLYERVKRNIDNTYLGEEIIGRWFPDINIFLIEEIIRESERKYSYWLTDIAFEALTIHIALSIKRFLSNKKFIDELNEDIKSDSIQYAMAAYIISQINLNFSIGLGDKEIYYVALHIGAKASSKIENTDFEISYLDFMILDLIQKVSTKIKVDLKSDEKLFKGLSQHINAALIRAKQNMIITNPLKESLINYYKDLYLAIVSSIEDIENQELILNTDDEITYILLHFAAAISRKEKQDHKLARILLICSTGVGTAELLLTNISKHFMFELIDTASEHNMKDKIKMHKYDFIISTIPVSTTIPHVEVSPILKEKDINNIRELMISLNFSIGIPDNRLMNNTAKYLYDLIGKYSSNSSENILKEEIIKFGKYLNENKVHKQGENIMLSDLLIKEHIKLKVECNDWEEAIYKSGELLINDNCITEEYIKAVIENVKEVGPYIVITKGVALPHATNEKGVNKTSLSLITLKKPIDFGNKNNDPVEFVFMLATTDSKSHLGALSDLAEILGRKEFIFLLKNAVNIENIIDYIYLNETR